MTWSNFSMFFSGLLPGFVVEPFIFFKLGSEVIPCSFTNQACSEVLCMRPWNG